MSEEKRCKSCKRIIVGDSKTGLCSDCMSKYGEGAAVGVGIAAALLVALKGVLSFVKKS